ncbi:MAG: hypothetical protein AAB342_04400 [Chloroflexota bacterium]
MPITYTNRKGRTYYLRQGVTKTGKPRYYFTAKAEGNPVDKIPEGYTIQESVNGIVSLAKDRPMLILEKETDAVNLAVKKHPKAKNYRVSVKSDRIEIYEHVGPNATDLFAAFFKEEGFPIPDANMAKRLQEEERVYGQFTPVMRFILTDEKNRRFRAQRMCYLGSIDDWIDIAYNETVAKLVSRLIPTLGTEEFFELF